MRPVFFVVLFCTTASLHPFLAQTAAAQSAPARVIVHGTIRDTSKAPIVGAVVTAAAPGQTAPASTTTNARGEFELSLPPGRYTVTAAADGFAPLAQPLSLSADTTTPDFVLQVAGIRDSRHREWRRSVHVTRHQQRHQDADAAARRAAVGHRRHQGADQGPADDEHRRRRALRARRHRASGREQPRPGRSSAATARRPTSSSTACATTCSTTATSTTSIASRRSRDRTR